MINQVRRTWSKILCQINNDTVKTSENNHSSSKALQLMWTQLGRICLGNSRKYFILSLLILVINEKTLGSKALTSNLKDISTWTQS